MVEQLEFNCDWGHFSPLWARNEVSPDDLGISAGLAAQFERFYSFWEQHFDSQSGWTSPSDCAFAHEEAERLTSLLRAETEGRYSVRNGFRHSFACDLRFE